MTAVLHLPVVYEAAGLDGARAVAEDLPFAVAARDRPGEEIRIEGPDGRSWRYAVGEEGRLWCPLAGPAGAATGVDDAAAAVRRLWSAMRLRSVPAEGPGRDALSVLKIGRRDDGTYYSCAPARAPSRRFGPGDRDARHAAVAGTVGETFAVAGGAVWRRSGAPVVKAVVSSAWPGVVVDFAPEGPSRHGAHAVWDPLRYGEREEFGRRLGRFGASPTNLPALPEIPEALRRPLSPRDPAGANAEALDACLRASMHEYLPTMSVEAFGDWLAVREAFEAAPEEGPSRYFAAVGRLAARADVEHDAPSAAARDRWTALAAGMAFAVARHRAEDAA